MPNRILIAAADDAESCKLQGWLNACECRNTLHAKDVLNDISDFQPHLIILDEDLPGQESLEVCRQLKIPPKNPLVLFISAWTNLANIEDAVRAGVDDFLSKPLNRAEFVRRVESLLKLSASLN